MNPPDLSSDTNPTSGAVQTGTAGAFEEVGAATPTGKGAPRRQGKRRGKRGRRGARPVKARGPAEPEARAAAAAAELAERAGAAPGAEGEPGGELAPEGGGLDLAAVAGEAAPVFRLAFKALALALRKRSPRAAESFYASASARGDALTATVGLRLAERFGGKLSIVAVVAELVEPFADDAWARPAAAPAAGVGDAK